MTDINSSMRLGIHRHRHRAYTRVMTTDMCIAIWYSNWAQTFPQACAYAMATDMCVAMCMDNFGHNYDAQQRKCGLRDLRAS